MNKRCKEVLSQEDILKKIDDIEDLSVEDVLPNKEGLVLWDDEEGKFLPARFTEKINVESLAKVLKISKDIPECYKPDNKVLAEYLLKYCDKNAFITLEQFAVIWSEPDDPETFEPADFEDELALRLCEEYGDEYTLEVGKGVLGQLWWERNIPVINMGEVVRAAQEVAKENEDIVDVDEFFSFENQLEMGLLTTVLHELRHLQMDTNIFLPEDGYPVELGSEEAVEEYCRSTFESSLIPVGLFPGLREKTVSLDEVLAKANLVSAETDNLINKDDKDFDLEN